MTKAKSPKKSNLKVITICAVSVISSVAATIASFVLVYQIFSKYDTLAQPDSWLTSDTTPRLFVSAKHHFSILFAGTPTTTNSTIDVGGVNVPYTTYERDNGERFYQVVVFEYPPAEFDMSDVDARLEDALNSSAQNAKDGQLLNSEFGTFAGYRSITGIIAVPVFGETIYIHETLFLKGNNLYLVQSSGASEFDFNAFRRSFRFN